MANRIVVNVTASASAIGSAHVSKYSILIIYNPSPFTYSWISVINSVIPSSPLPPGR